MKKLLFYTIITTLLLITTIPSFAQKGKKKGSENILKYSEIFNNLEYRLIGPFRGGRSAAVAGIPGNSRVFYQGATGGGVWKTEDAGKSWNNISDGFFGGTIGAVDVAQSDNNIVYSAGGEVTVRGNVSHGYGIWKSLNGGETWEYKGLKEGQYIPRLRVHPDNPNLVYAAVMGHLFGPNSERGIYRSTDGGDTWKNVLFVDKNTGGCDLILDPVNPRIIYASTWRIKRTPYSLESGGEGSGLWKSTDGGDTWISLNDMPGFPEGPIGIIGVTLSADNPKKVYAIIEATKGGLFVSDDRGEKWKIVNDDRNLRQRAWYYSRIYADPNDAETVYVLNVAFHKSTDGGSTFERIRTPHGDHHDLWIDPENSQIMIVADDGGAQVTHDGGSEWSTMMNQPTAQFYRVVTDNHSPYRIYGGQQDNSTVRIYSEVPGSGGITENDWEPSAGGESGWLAPDPENSDIVYGGSYGGYLQRLDHKTGESRRVDPWPDNPMGWGADSLKERFQWNFPIIFSRHNPDILFAASNRLFKTDNEGESWKQISPDLTRDDKKRMGPSGGQITGDNTSVEYYGTIFAVAESVTEEGVIWCGSDDGLINLTKDSGKTWSDVTPGTDIFPEWTMINSIEADPFNPGGLFIAATSYKTDDYKPYLAHTTDYGKTWNKIVTGISNDHFTRVVRADPEREGLLFCGTESGIYISFNNGSEWEQFQLNLPVVPITDLALKDNDLIVATQGRAFWIFDHVNILRKLDNNMLSEDYTVFKPQPAARTGRGRYRSRGGSIGQNPSSGVLIYYYLKSEPGENDNVRIDILDTNGSLIKSYRSNLKGLKTGSDQPYAKLDSKRGMNLFAWDMNYPGAMSVEGMILWAGSLNGPKAVPGDYSARFCLNNDSTDIPFEILKSPVTSSGITDIKEQFNFLLSIRDKLTETHQAIIDIRKMRDDIAGVEQKLDKKSHKDILETTGSIKKRITVIEEALYQTKNRSGQDPLNYPIKLGNKLASLNGVAGTGAWKPTVQSYKVRDELISRIDIQLERFYRIRDIDIPELNRVLNENNIVYIK